MQIVGGSSEQSTMRERVEHQEGNGRGDTVRLQTRKILRGV
jgi:hypothetical protein